MPQALVRMTDERSCAGTCRAWPRWLFVITVLVATGTTIGQEGGSQRRLEIVVDGIEGELRNNVLAFLSIARFQDQPVADDSRLRYLHAQAGEEIRQALQPFGYYSPTVTTQLERKPEEILARYEISPGEPVTVSAVDLQIDGAGRDQAEFRAIVQNPGIAVGDALRHDRYSALKGRIQEVAARFGYPEGRFQQRRLEVNPGTRQARVVLHFDTGPRYHLGEVDINQDVLRPELIQRLVRLKPGEPFDSERMLQVQSTLFGTDYFQSVLVSAEDPVPETRKIPVDITLEPRPRHRYAVGLGYATDTGPRARFDFENRLVNRRGHRYDTFVLLSGIRNQAGFRYRVPAGRPATDQYVYTMSYTNEDTDSKETEYFSLVAAYQRQTSNWENTNSLEYRRERFTVGGETTTSQLLVPGTSWTRVVADDRFRTRRGYSLNLSLRGAVEGVLSDTSFVQGRGSAKYVYSLGERDRLLLRGDVGSTWVEDFDRLPSSFRFYTGGDQSVRGYGYEDISPQDENGDPVGGRHLVVGSLEYEHRLSGPWSVAAFVDAGDAFNDEFEAKVGAGVGLRWQSPVGPVRLDVAHGFDEPGASVQIHLTIGPDL